MSRRSSKRLDEVHFAVIDFETTGLFPRHGDRVVEIGVALAGPDGRVQTEYETLVNPRRDVGPTRIHGIRARDVINAPEFAEVAGDLVEHIRGRVIVAHNARFDIGFLVSEFGRLGIELPSVELLCTLRMSRSLLPNPCARRLSDLCSELGIQLENAHSAVADARATSQLLQRFLGVARASGRLTLEAIGCEVVSTSGASWPRLVPFGRAMPRSRVEMQDLPPSLLASLAARLQSTEGPPDTPPEYLELLDRILEDRNVAREEADALVELAMQYGLTKLQVLRVHEDYLRRAVSLARLDGLISKPELRDLEELTALLGLPQSSLLSAIADPADANVAGERRSQTTASKLAGLTVCFTGDLQAKVGGVAIARAEAERLAAKAGLIPVKGVTRKLAVLVLADPASQSSKALKARDYGIRLIAESEFWRIIGVDAQW